MENWGGSRNVVENKGDSRVGRECCRKERELELGGGRARGGLRQFVMEAGFALSRPKRDLDEAPESDPWPPRMRRSAEMTGVLRGCEAASSAPE